MDAVSLRLVLGRAPGLRYEQLRSAVEKISALGKTPSQAPDIAAAEALIGERIDTLQSFGLGEAASIWLHAPGAAELDADRRWIARDRIELLDALRLATIRHCSRSCADAPALLYVRGDIEALRMPQLAIVGSRKSNATGAAACACSLPAELSQPD